MSDELVTLRIPKDLKKRMKKSKINWSQELRQSIERKLSASDRDEAIHELDAILLSVKPGFDSTRAIKESRRIG
jgi:hypothetical protein